MTPDSPSPFVPTDAQEGRRTTAARHDVFASADVPQGAGNAADGDGAHSWVMQAQHAAMVGAEDGSVQAIGEGAL